MYLLFIWGGTGSPLLSPLLPALLSHLLSHPQVHSKNLQKSERYIIQLAGT
jgi:hypothetical protein